MHGIKLFTRLRIGWSHLREHKLSHCFQKTINTLCSCGLRTKLSSHFFLHCQNFITPRANFMNELCKFRSNILNLDDTYSTKLLLHGDNKYENKVNKKILLASVNFILSTKGFEDQLM